MKKSVLLVKKICFYVLLSLTSVTFFSCLTTGSLEENLLTMALNGTVAVLEAGESTAKALEKITPANEYYIGRAVAATILTNYKTLDTPSKEKYVNKICTAITSNSIKPELYNGYHVKLLESEEINAFATSGGHIFITQGLYNCTTNEDCLAAAIAHEIAHIHLQHSLRAIKKSRWTNAGLSTASIFVKTVSDDSELASSMTNITNDTIKNLVNKGYSKQQEFEADTLALRLMSDAGYNPDAMLEMLNLLQNSKPKKAKGLFKTHPSPKKRIAKAKKALKKINKPEDTSLYRKERFTQSLKTDI